MWHSCSLGKVHIPAHIGVGTTEKVVSSITRAFAGSGGKHGSGDIFERCGERTGRKLPFRGVAIEDFAQESVVVSLGGIRYRAGKLSGAGLVVFNSPLELAILLLAAIELLLKLGNQLLAVFKLLQKLGVSLLPTVEFVLKLRKLLLVALKKRRSVLLFAAFESLLKLSNLLLAAFKLLMNLGVLLLAAFEFVLKLSNLLLKGLGIILSTQW